MCVRQRAFERVAQALVDHGVDTLFGLMGDANLDLIVHLTEVHGVRYIGTRHEATAVSMADGYSRATGKIGACTVTRGPGLSNTLTALTSVARAQSRVVLLAGDTVSRPSNLRALPYIQQMDQRQFGNLAGVRTVTLREGSTYQIVSAALHRVAREWLPTMIIMPADVQQSMELPLPVAYGNSGAGMPVETGIDEAVAASVASRLHAARQPLLIAGKGALRSGAKDAMIALAERTGAFLCTTLLAKDLFRGHPRDLGTIGGFRSPRVNEFIRGSDLVLAVGASLNDYSTVSTALFEGIDIIQIDRSADAFGRFMAVKAGIVADARTACLAILDRLPGTEPKPPASEIDVAIDDRWAEVGPERTGFIDPRALALRLNETLPPDRTLIVDSGHHCGFSSGYIRVNGPDRFMFALDFSSVGLGLGTALGAAVGRPDSLSVLAIGDGGLMMNLGDLHTAVLQKLPLLVVVWNDQAFGAEVHHLRHCGMADRIAFFPSPDLAILGQSFGLQSRTVTSVADLEAALADFDPSAGPGLLDCRVDPDVVADWIVEKQRLTVKGQG